MRWRANIGCAALILALGGVCATEAGVNMRLEKSRAVIIDWEVQDGIIVPITGVVTNRIELKTNAPKRRNNSKEVRRQLDRFFKERDGAAEASRGDASTPERSTAPQIVRLDRAPSPARTTTVVGEVKTAQDGSLRLTYAVPGGERTYELRSDAPVRALLAESGDSEVRAIVIGVLFRKETPPAIQVESAWLAPRLGTPETPDDEAAK